MISPVNGHPNGQANGKSSSNGNGKGRKKPAIAVETARDRLDAAMGSAVETEVTLLGSLLLMPTAIDDVETIIYPSDFWDAANAAVYSVMRDLWMAGKGVDLVLLVQALKDKGMLDQVGGLTYLNKIRGSVVTPAHAIYYARIIREKALTRHVRTACDETFADLLSTDDAAGIVERFEQRAYEVAEKGVSSTSNVLTAHDMMFQAFARFESGPSSLTAIKTGFERVDAMIGGLCQNELIIVGGRPGHGKCLGKGTRVVMFDGSLRAVEDIKAGDQLMGPDSTPRRVYGIGRGREQMYWVRQKRGIDYRVNESHLLSLVRCKTEKLQRRGTIRTISVRDLAAKPKSFLSRWRGYKAAIDFPLRTVPVDPYFLGLWLGDGKSDSSTIFNTDHEVKDYLREYAASRGQRLTLYQQVGKCPAYRIASRRDAPQHSMTVQLRRLGVLGNKHIPDYYLCNSRHIRLRLLAGLMDSDGHYNVRNNAFEIALSNERLLRQIKRLCDSLGYRTTFSEKWAEAQTGGPRKVWRLFIRGDIWNIPVKIARKKPRASWGQYEGSDWRWSPIKIERDTVDDYYGFELDGDGLFLLEDNTVTHNTAFGLKVLANICRAGHKGLLISLEMGACEITDRWLSIESEINLHRLRSLAFNPGEQSRLVQIAGELSNLPLSIEDASSRTVSQIAALARRQKSRHGLDALFIDYLQLVDTSDGNKQENRQEAVARVSRKLKNLARELHIPVVCLAQVNRGASETNRMPRLSELRESGGLEQDADKVLFVYRPKAEDLARGEQVDAVEPAQIGVGKQRNGPVGPVDVKFARAFAKFYEEHQATPAGGHEWTPYADNQPAEDFV